MKQLVNLCFAGFWQFQCQGSCYTCTTLKSVGRNTNKRECCSWMLMRHGSHGDWLTFGASSGHLRNCSFLDFCVCFSSQLWRCCLVEICGFDRHTDVLLHLEPVEILTMLTSSLHPLQDPDFQLLMAVYDENILKNPFYLALEKQRPDLCSRVAELHGIVSPTCSLPSVGILFARCYNQPVCLSEQQSWFPFWGFPQFLSIYNQILYLLFNLV